MTDKLYKPGDALHFELVDAATNKSNTFYLTAPALKLPNTTVLSLTALKKQVHLYGNSTGNCNNLNYTLALVFPKSMLNPMELQEIRLLDEPENWTLFVWEEETDCTIYLLSQKEWVVDNKLGLNLFRLPLSDSPSTITDISLLYRTASEPEVTYCLQTSVDILNRTGKSESPFKLFNDEPEHSIRKNSKSKFRLLNSTGKVLNLSRLRLQIDFDIFEDHFQSPEALMSKEHHENKGFEWKVSLVSDFKIKETFKMQRVSASGQTFYQAAFDFNRNAEILESLKSFGEKDQLVLESEAFTTYAKTGTAPVSISYFNVENYWDGKLSGTVQRIDEPALRQASVTDNQLNLIVGKSVFDRKTAANPAQDEILLQAAVVPSGVILMWSGKDENIPNGWALCDGKEGRPDLSGRFILGKSSKDLLHDKGGSRDAAVIEHTHTGTIEAGGAHEHELKLGAPKHHNGDEANSQGWPKTGHNSYRTSDRGKDVTLNENTSRSESHTHGFTIHRTGENGKDKNLPPYYVLSYIIKL